MHFIHVLCIITEKEREWNDSFCFIQGADTQFGMIENYLEHKENPGWTQEIELTKKAVQAANAMRPKPRFFIVCGDLVDAFPGNGCSCISRSEILCISLIQIHNNLFFR